MENRIEPFGVVFMPGGMNGAFWGGASRVLAPIFRKADCASGVSSGGHNMVSTYLGNKHAKDLWVNVMPSRAVFDLWRLPRGQYAADTQYLVNEHLRRCDLEQLRGVRTKLYVGTFDVWAGDTIFHRLTPENAKRLLHATIGYPFFAPWGEVNGRPHGDGGIAESPLHFMLDQGIKKIIVLDTYPLGHRMRNHGLLESWMAFPRPGMAKARALLRRRGTAYREAAKLALHPPPGVDILWLSPNYNDLLPTFHRDVGAASKLWDSGELAALGWWDRIVRFVRKR